MFWQDQTKTAITARIRRERASLVTIAKYGKSAPRGVVRDTGGDISILVASDKNRVPFSMKLLVLLAACAAFLCAQGPAQLPVNMDLPADTVVARTPDGKP